MTSSNSKWINSRCVPRQAAGASAKPSAWGLHSGTPRRTEGRLFTAIHSQTGEDETAGGMLRLCGQQRTAYGGCSLSLCGADRPCHSNGERDGAAPTRARARRPKVFILPRRQKQTVSIIPPFITYTLVRLQNSIGRNPCHPYLLARRSCGPLEKYHHLWACRTRCHTLPLVQRQHRDTGDSFTPTLEHAAQFFETLLGERPAGTA